MKKLLFTITIIAMLMACSRTSSAEPNTDELPESRKTITTLMMWYYYENAPRYEVYYTQSKPDTIIPTWQNKKVEYIKCDSVRNFWQDSTGWGCKIGYTLGSAKYHKLVKFWRR